MVVNLVVDTSVWSLVLRRSHIDVDNSFVQAFRNHLNSEDGLFLIGNILQELLDGLRSQNQFARLTRLLQPFPLLSLNRSTYVEAARLRAFCRGKGIQASPIDFLLASACIEQGYPLLSADRDFLGISSHSELVVLPPLKDALTS